ncbi:MAG TPA: alpha/beta hydrolase [Xanthobacteraceae bacterium]|nr:alpha/beta hydrolase [Xanthobacteraceae bacterium]
MPVPIEDIWFSASDGLRLHALAMASNRDNVPAVCLPGISRTAEDFRMLLAAFAKNGNARPAFALDSRGRGLSGRDNNPANYSVPVELADLITFLDTQNIERAIFVGTSRGGILTMALASIMPQRIAGAVLNDVGPVLDMAGLLRIKGYVGKLPPPRSWAEAVKALKSIMAKQFPAFAEQDWESYARRTWDDRFQPRSDPAISAAFAGIDADNPPPALWPQFDSLAAAAPILVLRGEHSDLLSRETLAEMRRRAPRLETFEVAGQGHAPALERADVIEPILRFVARCDP